MTHKVHLDLRMFSEKKEFIAKALQLIYDIQPKTVALSGGSSPVDLYKALSNNHLPLHDIDFFQVDERYVDKKDKESNFRMIKKTLFKEHRPKSFEYFDTSLPINKAVSKYEDSLKQAFKNKKSTFDLTILGMGSDGHIASLFPDCAALDHKKELAAHTKTNKNKVKDRLTLTLPPILKSKNILLLLKGIEKLKALEQLTHGKKEAKSFPAKKLIGHKKLTIFFLID